MTAPVAARQHAAPLGVLAICSAVGVGTIYFPQALLVDIGAQYEASVSVASLVATAPQLGYAVGILLLVPRGDAGGHRRLLTVMFSAVAAAAVIAAAAPSLVALVVASFAMGVATVASPVIGPLAAGSVDRDRMGWVSGILLGASIAGMIGSRVCAALIAPWLSWRAAYAFAAAAALMCAWLVHSRVPPTSRGTMVRFPGYLRAPLRELRRRPVLRRSALLQMCTFAGFTATWTTLGPALTNDLQFPAGAVGWVALVALAAMVTVPWTGRVVDRVGPDRVNTWALGGTLLAALLMTGQLLGGFPGLVALVLGVLVLDVAMQSGMVANVTRFYRIDAFTRSAMNTAYMTCAFVAGSFGSWFGARLYEQCGWIGIPLLVAGLAATGLLVRSFYNPHRETDRAGTTSPASAVPLHVTGQHGRCAATRFDGSTSESL